MTGSNDHLFPGYDRSTGAKPVVSGENPIDSARERS